MSFFDHPDSVARLEMLASLHDKSYEAKREQAETMDLSPDSASERAQDDRD